MNNRGTRLICRLMVLALVLSLALGINTNAQTLPPNHVDDFTGKPRLVVLTDMGNEPDDQSSTNWRSQSLVR